MNQNNKLVSIRITDGVIPFHEVSLYGVEREPSVQFSEDALIDFAKKHPLLDQLELYVGQMKISLIIVETFFSEYSLRRYVGLPFLYNILILIT